jgi:uncharacterized protein YaiE (UPF0345 family)
VFVKRTGVATGFDDVALADAALTEVGVPWAIAPCSSPAHSRTRWPATWPRARRSPARRLNAYEKAMVGVDIAGFEVFKNDQSIRLAAATGGATTVNGANQYRVPKAFSTAATGEMSNVDNRYSDLIITAAVYANIKAGDAFTIAGVNSVNMITKQDTGQLQTFRVISKPAANTIRIAPAIISNGGDPRRLPSTRTSRPLRRTARRSPGSTPPRAS